MLIATAAEPLTEGQNQPQGVIYLPLLRGAYVAN